jgi:hypothetical protein
VENPWLGKTSQFTVHQDEANLWNEELPKVRSLAINEDLLYDIRDKVVLAKIAFKLKTKIEDLSYISLIGSRVVVTWTAAQGAKGKWKGRVVDYEPLLGKHWIKYDIQDELGEDTYPQDLINKLNTWSFSK